MNSKIKEYRNEITQRVIEALKEGTAPWQRPWSGDCAPQNAVSKRHYNGANTIVLSMMGLKIDGGADPRWLTFHQAAGKGWNVRKGEHGTRISLWKSLAVPVEDALGNPCMDSDDNPMTKNILLEKPFTVFHASQVEGIPAFVPKFTSVIEANEKAERILADSGADIRYGGDRAFYRPSDDFIQLPRREYFADTASYYATALHEAIHWTAHASRLNRDIGGTKGSISYAREELVAEIGSMFISTETGIPQTEEHFSNHVAYVASWIEVLNSDPNALFKAASDASKAAEFLLRMERQREAEEAEPEEDVA